MSWRGRIILTGPTSGSGARCASGSCTDSRPNSAARSRACPASPRAACPGAGSLHCGSCRGCSRCNRLNDGFVNRRRCRLGRWDDGSWRGSNEQSGVRCRGAQLHVLQSLTRCAITASGTSASAASGSRPAAAYGWLSLEAATRGGIDNQKEDERMSKKRGSGTLPPPLSLARYPDRRPIPSLYVDGWSFGETPITFTPAPRATSIA